MDKTNYTTDEPIRERGKHLIFEDRVIIQTLLKEGHSQRYIASVLNCSRSTIHYEIKRGTRKKTSNKGPAPKYSARYAQKQYEQNRKSCGRKNKVLVNNRFIAWVAHKVRCLGWSIDESVGRAKLLGLFSDDEIVCTKTLYNAVHAQNIAICLFDLPEAVSRRQAKRLRVHKNKRSYGRSIEERPAEASNRSEFGHWEFDTVVGKRKGKEAVILTGIEKLTRFYIAIKIPGKDTESVKQGMIQLHEEFGSKFGKVFKTITVDNGSEFATFTEEETDETSVYFAHPYSSWERGQNERYNRIFRNYVPKRKSIEFYSENDILSFADSMNDSPRRVLSYRTPNEMFEEHLDRIYALEF